ncbi:MAG: BamA/TamA family outer membrane protein [Flavobacteriales bacterium]
MLAKVNSYTDKTHIHIWVMCLLALISGHSAFPQADTVEKSSNSAVVIPLIFYKPETRWGVGVAGITAFRFRNEPDSSKESQVHLGLAYTQENQALFYMPYDVFFNNEKWRLYGELGYYKYFYRFFGIGNGVENDVGEPYKVNYPRLRITALRQLSHGLYAGLRYWFEHYDIVELDSTGLLISGDITGSEGGATSGLGANVVFDNRDMVFDPGRGWLVDASVQWFGQMTGSDYAYAKYRLDASRYVRTVRGQALAINAYVILSSGNPPFNRLALLGGHQHLRGYYMGRYADRQMWTTQVEYRIPLFWRIGITGFGGCGMVAPALSGFKMNNMRYAGGGGIRFSLNKKDRINIRLDAGFGKDTHGYYLTIGEAF